MGGGLMRQRQQFSVLVAARRILCILRCRSPTELKHLLSVQGKLNRPAYHFSGHCRQDEVGPLATL